MGRYGWKNEDGVRGTVGTLIRADAACMECPWSRMGRSSSANAIRVAARRHASINRHKVRIVNQTARYFEVDR